MDINWEQRQYCNQLSLEKLNSSVVLAGWIDTIRDHGQLLFMHLRDRTGVVQIVFNPEENKALYEQANTLRGEYCIGISGKIIERSDDAKNLSLPTGMLEVHVLNLNIFNKSKTPPFVITEKSHAEDTADEFNVDEDLRLKYRYLDLRRLSMQQKLITRYKVMKIIRDYLDLQGFIDIETPCLTKSTPEGARDYLVASRHHDNTFYALPQSPQMFKQLLMVSGFDKYYQIVKCFRDEDLRPNRQPEFTQLDLEASFINETAIYNLFEPLIQQIFESVGKKIQLSFPHITYDDALNYYGNDHPDLRFEMKMIDVSSFLQNVNYKIFQSILKSGGVIKVINVKNKASDMSKNMLQEELAKKVVPTFGGKGMSWMKYQNSQLVSNIVQFFSQEEQDNLIKQCKVEEGDVLLFIADNSRHLVNEVLGKLRLYVAEKWGFIDKSKIAPCWVTEFPMFELTKDQAITSTHHPFTQPDESFLHASTKEELLKVKSRAYDLVINGEEVGGGSIRIHDSATQEKIFKVLGLSENDIKEKFGFFVEALQYGTPPHGGIALGMDRLIAMITESSSIREVIAFPKNRVAFCPLTKAPSCVDEAQLTELKLALIKKEEENV